MDLLFSHRIALSNIATPCHVVGSSDTFVLAIQNDSARQAGRIEYGGIGGGALISNAGIEALSQLGTMTFEPHDDGVRFDARITFGAETPEKLSRLRISLLRTLLGWARTGASDLIELDITREHIEELVDDKPGILTMTQLTSTRTRLVGWKCGTMRRSRRGADGVFTTPLYLCHEVVFEDPRVLEVLLTDPLERVRRVSPEELATTNHGTKEGRTWDGHALFTNVFDPKFIRKL